MANGIIIVTGGAGGLGIIEYPSYQDFPITGEAGYLYLAANADLLYRWDGLAYRMLSSSLTLGETSTTAYRGDRGKLAYDHSVLAHAPSNANYYEHPLSHPPAIIAQDATNRFVTDAEKTLWNSKTSLALGVTSLTAYRGDHGLIAYNHAVAAHAPSDAPTGSAFTGHTGNATIHITSGERITWNAKQDALGFTPLNANLKGAVNGLAELDDSGHIPAGQLPSYVDDVLEFAASGLFPNPGETGKIYIDISSNLSYRWSGTQYSVISPSLALGETSMTAYRGDRGKIAYDHSQVAHAPSNANYYVHPATHPPSIILQDTSNRFVTDAEIALWTNKQDDLGSGTGTQYLRGDMTWATPPNTEYSEISIEEINVGTSATLRAITARRLKYAVDTAVSEGTGITVTTLENRVEMAVDASVVAVGIADYEPDRDLLQVFANSTFIARDRDYTVDTVNKTIVSTDSDWAAPVTFDFFVIKSYYTPAPTASVNGGLLMAGTVDTPALSLEVQGGLVTQASRDEWSGKQDDLGTGTTAQYLRGDGVWASPPDTTYAAITEAEISAGTSTISRAITAARLKYAFDNVKAASAANADAVPWTGVSGKPAFLALGETSATAYRGDHGLAAYNHSLAAHAPANANYYVHPGSHPATMIVEDTTHKFVTDAEKSTWNAKSNLALGTTSLTAFRGDQGLTAYNHSQAAHAPSDAPSSATFTSHTGDIVAHITGTERSTWNAKSNLALGTTSVTAYRGDHGLIAYNHAGAAHAPSDAPTGTAFTTHTGDSVIHITGTERTNWNAAHTHRTSTGVDHTYIDQDVRTSASPSFAHATVGGTTDSAIFKTGSFEIEYNAGSKCLEFNFVG